MTLEFISSLVPLQSSTTQTTSSWSPAQEGAIPAQPDPTPVVQAQLGYAPRAELVPPEVRRAQLVNAHPHHNN